MHFTHITLQLSLHVPKSGSLHHLTLSVTTACVNLVIPNFFPYTKLNRMLAVDQDLSQYPCPVPIRSKGKVNIAEVEIVSICHLRPNWSFIQCYLLSPATRENNPNFHRIIPVSVFSKSQGKVLFFFPPGIFVSMKSTLAFQQEFETFSPKHTACILSSEGKLPTFQFRLFRHPQIKAEV